MPIFYFRTTDQEGYSAEDRGFEFDDEEAAVREAKVALPDPSTSWTLADPSSTQSLRDFFCKRAAIKECSHASVWVSSVVSHKKLRSTFAKRRCGFKQ
jgi:hypothetical protein